MSVDINGNILLSSGFTVNAEINDPVIPTDQLVFWYDPGNIASHPPAANYYDCGYGCQYYSSDPGCVSCNNRILDMSGNGYDGSSADSSIFTYSKSGGSMFFNDLTDFLTVSGFTSDQIFTEEMTCIAWFNWSGSSRTTSSIMGTQLHYVDIQSATMMNINIGYGSGSQMSSSVLVNLVTNRWYMVAWQVKKTGTSLYYRVFLDNQIKIQNSFANIPYWGVHRFYIGTERLDVDHHFDGFIGPCLTYKTYLTDEQIKNIFNAIRPRYYNVTEDMIPVPSPSMSPTPSTTITPTVTPTITPTRTATPTPTVTPSRTPSVMATPSVTPSLPCGPNLGTPSFGSVLSDSIFVDTNGFEDNYNCTLTERGICYGINYPPTVNDYKWTLAVPNRGGWAQNISGLSPGTTYYFCHYIIYQGQSPIYQCNSNAVTTLAATPTPTPTRSTTPSVTPSPTRTSTPSITPTPSVTPTRTPAPTPSITPSPSDPNKDVRIFNYSSFNSITEVTVNGVAVSGISFPVYAGQSAQGKTSQSGTYTVFVGCSGMDEVLTCAGNCQNTDSSGGYDFFNSYTENGFDIYLSEGSCT